MADVVYFDSGITFPFCPSTVSGIYISGSGCCSNFYTAFVGGNQEENITYVLPSSGGTNGQVLTNDGNGNLSWTTITDIGVKSISAPKTVKSKGTGIIDRIAKWFSSDTVTNSIILETGSTIDISGSLRVGESIGTPTAIVGKDSSGYISNLSLGDGLFISNGTLLLSNDLMSTYLNSIPEYDSDAAAIAAGLSVGDFYCTSSNHLTLEGGILKKIQAK